MGEGKKYRVFVSEFLPPLLDQREQLESVADIIMGNKKYSEEEIIPIIKDLDAVFVTSKAPMTKRVISSCNKLKVIGKYGVGLDPVDVPAATSKGIPVTHTPGVNQDTVAELTIGLILAVTRRIPYAMEILRRGGEWRNEKFLGMEIKGSTLGIIGLGRIGSRVAEKMKSFEVTLLACDPYVSEEKGESLGVKLVDLKTLLQSSDIITLNLPATSETYHIIDEKSLRLMKPTSYLVNTARGSLVDGKALYRALKEGWIAGAALDVFEKEPTSMDNPSEFLDNPLLFLDNVVVTPHIGGSSVTARSRMVRTAVGNVVKILKGEVPIENVANPEVFRKS